MSVARWFTHPRFFMAPIADGGEGEGGGEGGEGAGDDAGEGGEPEKPVKPAAAEKPAKGAKEKPAAAAKPAAKPGEKGAEKPAEAKKTLLGGKGAAAKPAAAGEEGGEGEGEEGAGDDGLEAWKPELPEGVTADEELLGELKGIGKKLNLKGEQLQDVVTLGTKMQEKLTQGFLAAHEEHVAGLEKTARADKEIGGAKLDGVVQNGLALLKKHAGEDFDSIVGELERTGLGSHPGFLKLLNRLHEATKEDDTVARTGRGAGGAPARKSFTERMYPKMTKELAKQRGEAVDED
jgi:hypothetical protein